MRRNGIDALLTEGRLILWHGSTTSIDRFDPARTRDGGIHFGTFEQASMRNSRYLYQAELDVERLRRSRDRGGDWKNRIARARWAGFSGLIYLNRWEGLATETVRKLALGHEGTDPDAMTDAAFRRLVPEARDSVIILDAARIRVLSVRERPLAG